MSWIVTFHKPEKRTAFKAGKLYLFSPRQVLVVSTWPQLLAWAKSDEMPIWRGWRTVDEVNLNSMERMIRRTRRDGLAPPGLVRRARAYRQFLDAIPEPAKALVRQFPDRHWALLRFLAGVGQPAVALAASTPALAYLCANYWVFGRKVGHPRRVQARLCGLRRRDALGWFGFPPEERVVRIMQKIPACAVSIHELRLLRDSMAENGVPPVLSHVKHVNTPVIIATTNEILAERVAPSLMLELGRKRGRPGLSDEIRMVVDVAYRQWEGPFGDVQDLPTRLTSLAQVWQAHRRIIDAVTGKPSDASLLGLGFPPPPFDAPGNGWIRPLDTPAKVAEESRQMRHCLLPCYAQRIAAGKYYAYRILTPERATVGLERRGRKWCLDQIRGYLNAPAGRATWSRVRTWLARRAQSRLHADEQNVA